MQLPLGERPLLECPTVSPAQPAAVPREARRNRRAPVKSPNPRRVLQTRSSLAQVWRELSEVYVLLGRQRADQCDLRRLSLYWNWTLTITSGSSTETRAGTFGSGKITGYTTLQQVTSA